MAAELIPPTALIQMLMVECGFDRRRTTSNNNFDIHYLNLNALKLKVSPDGTPFVVSRRLSIHPHVTIADLYDFLQLWNDGSISGSSCILVLGGTLQALKPSTRRALANARVAVLSRNDFQKAYENEDGFELSNVVAAALVASLGRQALSPYHSTIPAVAGSFFGRAQILKKVFAVQDNFVFVGNRRIGKTSLLREIKHRLSLAKGPITITELYGATCSTEGEVLIRLLKDIDPSGNFERHATITSLKDVFRSTVMRLAKQSLVVVIIDELDKLLEFDHVNDHSLMDTFRDVFNKTENTRFYAAGFRRARQAARDNSTPLFGFTKHEPLGRLTLHETRDMVELPLLRLGIDVHGTPITEAIYTETTGHPELVQMCCAEIIRLADEGESVSSPTELLTQVFQSGEFREKVLGAFMSNANAPERLASYLLMQMGIESGITFDNLDFDFKEINKCLKRVGKELTDVDLYTVTDHLLLCGVLVQQSGGQRFRFAVPQLGRYCQNYDLDFMIEKSLDEVGALTTWSEVIRTEPEKRL
jgi:hypothetical protein